MGRAFAINAAIASLYVDGEAYNLCDVVVVHPEVYEKLVELNLREYFHEPVVLPDPKQRRDWLDRRTQHRNRKMRRWRR